MPVTAKYALGRRKHKSIISRLLAKKPYWNWHDVALFIYRAQPKVSRNRQCGVWKGVRIYVELAKEETRNV